MVSSEAPFIQVYASFDCNQVERVRLDAGCCEAKGVRSASGKRQGQGLLGQTPRPHTAALADTLCGAR